MKTGLVFGKFMPLHTGHLSLIKFALENCNKLYVVLCHSSEEIISGKLREQWLKKALEKYENIILISFHYDPQELPNSQFLQEKFQKHGVIFLKK